MIPRGRLEFPLPPDIDLTEDEVFRKLIPYAKLNDGLLPWEKLESDYISLGTYSGGTWTISRNDFMDVMMEIDDSTNGMITRRTGSSARNIMFNTNVTTTTTNVTTTTTNGQIRIRVDDNSNTWTVYSRVLSDGEKIEYESKYEGMLVSPPYEKDRVKSLNISDYRCKYNEYKRFCLDIEEFIYDEKQQGSRSLVQLHGSFYNLSRDSIYFRRGKPFINIELLKVPDDKWDEYFDDNPKEDPLPWERNGRWAITPTTLDNLIWSV